MNYQADLRRSHLTNQQRDYKLWPTTDINLLSEKEQIRFSQRYDAIIAYLEGETLKHIQEKYRITHKTVRRYLSRCLKRHHDGRIWGFRALIPYQRIKTYERSLILHDAKSRKKMATAGLLGQLFFRFPHIQDAVDALFLKKVGQNIIHESRIPLQYIHQRFLKMCRTAGIKGDDYPFNVRYLGYRSISSYLTKLKHREIVNAVKARHGKDAARTLRISGKSNRTPIIEAFRRVQFDGHRIDAIFTISMPGPYGVPTEITITRPWLLLIQEITSRAVLGYHLCLKQEFSSDDVLECVKSAIVPWKPRTPHIPSLKYSPNSGLPSGIIDELAWVVWDVFEYDNAKANLSEHVTDKLINTVGCSINAGPVKMPEKRGHIERLFGILEESGFHRLPSTTGSNPSDGRRNQPEKNAIKLKISIEALEDITDVLIANYNATPHGGIGHRSPLEYLEFYLQHHLPVIRKLSEKERATFSLHTIKIECTVRGNINQGKRPYVYYAGARYSNEVLSRSSELIGVTISLTINTRDIRTVQAFLPDGSEFGILTALGSWGRTPHDLRTRKAINSLCYRRILHISLMEDPIAVYLDWLANQAKSSKSARAEYANIIKGNPIAGQGDPCEKSANNSEDMTPANYINSGTEADPIKKRFSKVSKTVTY